MSYARFTVILLTALTFVAFVAQFGIDFSSVNIASACIVLASTLCVLLYLHWTDAIHTHPLSTFAIFGFCLTTQLGALLVQSATWTSLSLNLRQPIATFGTLALFQLIALLAHGTYRLFSNSKTPTRSSLIRPMLEKLGLYVTPTAGTLWIMGWFGFMTFFFGTGGEGILSKVLQGMTFVAWAPFLIPLFRLQQGAGYCNFKKTLLYLGLYASLVALVGMAANSRGLMLSGFMTIAVFVLLSAMRSTRQVTASQVAKMGVVTVLLASLTIPVTDLVTAMGIARQSRSYASGAQMVGQTLYYFQQPHQLAAQREKDKSTGIQSLYDETYFANSLMGRLMETKFHDNALYFSSRLNAKDEEKMLDITGDFFWSTLPEPLLKALEVNVNKENLKFSMGDYLSHLSGAGSLGGYKTGSGFAQGIAIFGYFFPLIYLLVCPLLFLSKDVLSYRSSQGNVVVSALGMLGIWKLFQYGITAESLQALFMGVMRGLPQNIVLFLVIFHLARVSDRLLGSFRSMPRPFKVEMLKP